MKDKLVRTIFAVVGILALVGASYAIQETRRFIAQSETATGVVVDVADPLDPTSCPADRDATAESCIMASLDEADATSFEKHLVVCAGHRAEWKRLTYS